MNYFIYKYVDKNKTVVYIGQTVSLQNRWYQHKKDKYGNLDMYYFNCDSRTQMDTYEYLLIQKYRPKYNSNFKKDIVNKINFTLEEPEWKKFISLEDKEKISLLQIDRRKYKHEIDATYRPKEEIQNQGRKRVQVDKQLFIEVNNLYECKKITAEEAQKRLNISHTTFFKIRRSAQSFFEDKTIIIRKPSKNNR